MPGERNRKKRGARPQWVRSFFYRLHRYAGLAAGLVFFITAVTGAMLVFEDEIRRATHPHRYIVDVEGETRPIEANLAAALAAVPEGQSSSLTLYADPARPYQFGVRDSSNTFYYVYTNPYTAAVIEVANPLHSVFSIAIRLHRFLLAGQTGKLIVGVSTVLVLSLMLSGLYLWWPRTKAVFSKRTRVKWAGTNWKRRAYDLHAVLGFYTMWILIITAATGLVWSFDVVEDAVYWLGGGERSAPRPTSAVVDGMPVVGFNAAVAGIKAEIPHFTQIRMTISSRPDGVVQGLVRTATSPHQSAYDRVYLDKYTGAHLRTDLHADAPGGTKARRLIYPIHVGSIFGLPSKIVVFLVCMVAATFPVTGVYLWFIRWRKRRSAKQKRCSTERKAAQRKAVA
ncbi:MAG: PepSY-associated TM helix domain-containing protein [Bacteroidota bacterium]